MVWIIIKVWIPSRRNCFEINPIDIGLSKSDVVTFFKKKTRTFARGPRRGWKIGLFYGSE